VIRGAAVFTGAPASQSGALLGAGVLLALSSAPERDRHARGRSGFGDEIVVVGLVLPFTSVITPPVSLSGLARSV